MTNTKCCPHYRGQIIENRIKGAKIWWLIFHFYYVSGPTYN
ncbi:MAG TPA: hypothetical protein VEF33_12675 [Syntrophales bacterium]|nr:hypothetical protein [Syntrophales bacterium]